MGDDWTSAIAGERMALDTEFADRVAASSFSRQQWSLVMTALEFQLENPEDPDAAEIVPDTSNLPTIMPELDNVPEQGMMGGQPRDSGGGSGGLIDSVTDALGLGGSDDDERLAEAESLAAQYAELLQERLESNGRWEAVCERARS